MNHQDLGTLEAADLSVLDDVVWAALMGPHAHLALGGNDFKHYDEAVAPFASVRHQASKSIASSVTRLAPGQSLAFVTPDPLEAVDDAIVVVRASLLQMVLMKPPQLDLSVDAPMTALSMTDVPNMLSLVESTRPGPFGPRTIEMGTYLGIRQAGRIVAMAGERLKVPGFTEISGVCVDQAWRGRGYAGALVQTLAKSILARDETPFLHVVEDNQAAITLYDRIGFRTRRKLNLTLFKRNER